MKIRYIGIHDAVQVDAWDHLVVERGDIADVSDEQGCVACEQTANWIPGDDESHATFVEFLAYVAALAPVDEVPDDPDGPPAAEAPAPKKRKAKPANDDATAVAGSDGE